MIIIIVILFASLQFRRPQPSRFETTQDIRPLYESSTARYHYLVENLKVASSSWQVMPSGPRDSIMEVEL